MRILRCGVGWSGIEQALAARLGGAHEVVVADPARPIPESARGFEVLVPSAVRIDGSFLDLCPSVRLVHRAGVGYEGIDLEAAKARGVAVCNAPGTNPVSVAEFALMLMLMLARKVPLASRLLREGGVGLPNGIELAGRSALVVGAGACGTALAVRLSALGMRVSGIRRSLVPPSGVAWASFGGGADLPRLLEGAEFVVLCVPLSDATRHLIDAAALARLRPGAFLVNVSRGAVVDQGALVAALRSGHLAGAGLDVLEKEPPDPSDSLLAMENVVPLPHIAGSTEEALARTIEIIADNVGRLSRGEPLRHRVG
ncbi:MAG: lactate dehydrogenase [Planctomycetes bacterium]|nr:lactate dehydrogenase [Planctomycetota bacterium]